MRLLTQVRAGKQIYIIHLGDHDPSGLDMSRDIRERIDMFMSRHPGKALNFELNRIALNMDQVRQYSPPPNPAKITDSRASKYIKEFGNESWELDALEPSLIVDRKRPTITRTSRSGKGARVILRVRTPKAGACRLVERKSSWTFRPAARRSIAADVRCG